MIKVDSYISNNYTMISTLARAAFGPNEPFKTTSIQRRNLGPEDVLIEIHYCGICHSDIHSVHGDWWRTKYPIVPGHEIAGIVTKIGSEVTKHSVGDRVGVGCLVNSCGECSSCHHHEEQYCLNGYVGTYWSIDRDGTITHGGYSNHIVVTQDFVLKIPDTIALDVAAPLLCAGITTYSPLRHWAAGPGKKIAIVGLGGLGHMAVKIAHAMGADVTVLSHSLAKQSDSIKFGASQHFATSDPETFQKLSRHFDLIINTVSANINLDQYLSLLALDGTLVNVGAPATPLSLQVFSLILQRRSFAGSLIGWIQETQEMLDFCAEHNIWPEIEVISADKIDEAYGRILTSDVRYRFVIDTKTIIDEY